MWYTIKCWVNCRIIITTVGGGWVKESVYHGSPEQNHNLQIFNSHECYDYELQVKDVQPSLTIVKRFVRFVRTSWNTFVCPSVRLQEKSDHLCKGKWAAQEPPRASHSPPQLTSAPSAPEKTIFFLVLQKLDDLHISVICNWSSLEGKTFWASL